MKKVYLNNAATSYPKPKSVLEAVQRSLSMPPVEPGRGGQGEKVGADPTLLCRQGLASLLEVETAEQIILSPSATYAINLVLWGALQGGEHVISTVLEHNSVLRPLSHLGRERGVETTYLEPDPTGEIEVERLEAALRPSTALIALTHASNVTGSIQPVEAIAALAAQREIPLLIDASQSAGAVPLSHAPLPGRVFIVFAGHKGLLGPSGVGGLVVPDAALPPLVVGGTGIRSENPFQPEGLPLQYEAGTPNFPGIAGLVAGVTFVQERGVEALGRHRHELVQRLRSELQELAGVHLLPLAQNDGRAGIVSFTWDRWKPEELGFLLEESFGMEIRVGLHCAPRIHDFFGTRPLGTIRFSVGPFNDMSEVEYAGQSLRIIARQG